jgi:L-ascorbate 6-phosphate lactonase
MERLAASIMRTAVDDGSLAIFWISQAGFVYKTPGGQVIYVDPYFTNYVERILPEYGYGFKRIMASPIELEEVEADLLLSTHSHPDHLDMDALPTLAQDPRLRFAGAPDCPPLYGEAGIAEERYSVIRKGETLDFGGYAITGVAADHGELAPDALGIILTVGDIRVWQAGDTAYRPDLWQDIFELGIDVIVPPINGAFGNLDGVEAAKLAGDCGAKVAIPSHFWMFPLHDGDPMQFIEACKEHAPDTEAILLSQGELYTARK